MRESKALEALFPGARRPLICSLFGEPDRWWSLADLAGRAGIRAGSVRPHLLCLQEAGLIREKQEGGKAWFQADPSCQVYDDLRSIVNKLSTKANGGETILIVEDQPATAQITRILLESWGYQVLEAHTMPEAFETFEKFSSEIHLLLTDVNMPEITGPQLAREFTRRKPNLRVVYMSGYPDDHISAAGAAFLPKPFNPASLSRMVRKELDRMPETAGHMKSS